MVAQLVDHLQIMLFGEEIGHALRDDGANILNLLQALGIGSDHPVKLSKMPRQIPGGCLADVAIPKA